MKLEQQVVNLELAQKLKELGVEQESLFYYVRLDLKHWEIEQGVEEYSLDYIPNKTNKITDISAFTVAELGEMLPNKIIVSVGCEYDLFIGILGLCWQIMYSRHDGTYYETTDKNEANARAEMLIYLLENKLITLT